MKYVLFTDSDTDITPDEAEFFGYQVISMPYIIGEKTYFPYVSWKEYDYKSYFNLLRKGTIPTTCALSPNEYIAYIEPWFKKGLDIVYACFSTAMSGTFNALNLALEDLKEKYPERKLHLIDTKGITVGSYNLVMEIGEKYKAGCPLEELVEWGNKEADHFAAYFFADDLKFFAKSGRVSGLAAFFGSMVGIKPIIFMDSDGKMKTFGKERGKKQIYAKMISIMDEIGDDVTGHRIVLTHADSDEWCDEFEKLIRDKYGPEANIVRKVINPTAGAHCGPGGVAVSFHSIHR